MTKSDARWIPLRVGIGLASRAMKGSPWPCNRRQDQRRARQRRGPYAQHLAGLAPARRAHQGYIQLLTLSGMRTSTCTGELGWVVLMRGAMAWTVMSRCLRGGRCGRRRKARSFMWTTTPRRRRGRTRAYRPASSNSRQWAGVRVTTQHCWYVA